MKVEATVAPKGSKDIVSGVVKDLNKATAKQMQAIVRSMDDAAIYKKRRSFVDCRYKKALAASKDLTPLMASINARGARAKAAEWWDEHVIPVQGLDMQ